MGGDAADWQDQLPIDFPVPIERANAEPDWRRLSVEVGKAFRPTTPVSELDVFAGREPQITRICDVIMQPGQHAILFGERGVGKTSLANVLSAWLEVTGKEGAGSIVSPRVNCDGDDTFDSVWRKVFGKIHLSRELRPIGFNAEPDEEKFSATALLGSDYQGSHRRHIDPDAVQRVLTRLGRPCLTILIVDEFDQLAPAPRKTFADLVKMLSDYEIPATVVLVGVSETVDGLLRDHESVGRALVQVKMPRMTPKEIYRILITGAKKLGMVFDLPAVRRITAMSGGLPHYAHLLGLHSAREALNKHSLAIRLDHVRSGIKLATDAAQQSVQRAYHEAIRSAQKGNLFADVLLACAMAECDELGYFKAQDVRGPMCDITGKPYDIPNFAQHLSEFSGQKRGQILQVVGEKRRLSYHFRDPLMQPFVLMQGEVSGRLPEGFYSESEE